ncbi:MAG: hypothetical protein ACYDIE_07635 [Candidatus Krumholzibacteriia bacterium]
MNRFRWLLVTLLALTLLSASGIAPASAATVTLTRDLTATSTAAAAPPTIEAYSGSSGGGNVDGDPDDIIEGNRLVAVTTGLSTQTAVPGRAGLLLCVQVGGVILLLRRLMP